MDTKIRDVLPAILWLLGEGEENGQQIVEGLVCGPQMASAAAGEKILGYVTVY